MPDEPGTADPVTLDVLYIWPNQTYYRSDLADKVIAAIKEANADFALVGSFVATDSEYEAFVEACGYEYSYYTRAAKWNNSDRYTGHLIMSRYPLENTENLAVGTKIMAYAQTEISGMEVDLYAGEASSDAEWAALQTIVGEKTAAENKEFLVGGYFKRTTYDETFAGVGSSVLTVSTNHALIGSERFTFANQKETVVDTWAGCSNLLTTDCSVAAAN